MSGTAEQNLSCRSSYGSKDEWDFATVCFLFLVSCFVCSLYFIETVYTDLDIEFVKKSAVYYYICDLMMPSTIPAKKINKEICKKKIIM